MKKKYLIAGLFSIIFGIGYSFGLEDGIYHNSSLGLISVVKNGNAVLTLQDKNIGATCTDINSSCSYGNYYQYGNNYGFSNSLNYTITGCNFSGFNQFNYFNSNGIICNKLSYNSFAGDIWGLNSSGGVNIKGPCDSGFSLFYDFSFYNNYLSSFIDSLSNGKTGNFFNQYLLFPFAGRRAIGSSSEGSFSNVGSFGFYSLNNYYNVINSVPYIHSLSMSSGSFIYDAVPLASYLQSIRCVKNTVVNPDSSWSAVLLNGSIITGGNSSPCDDLNGKTGTISIIETDTGTYYILTLGDGVACTLPNDFGLSGGAIQIQNNNTWSGTITIVDDSYITYTDLSGSTILITTGYDINKGTWENILTAFSGHQLTIYETDQGTYYTFVDNNGQIKTADVNGVFQYLNQQLQFTGLQTGSYNMMTANRWYGQMLDKGRHFFQCGVDFGTKNIFSARVSDYYYVAKVVDKLDTNLLGFMLCPFYSLLAGISDNFDNSTMMRSGYKPILNHTGYFNHGSSVNRGKFYSFFDATLIFVIFITYGSIFYFIIRKF